jgi:hypothetical protein
LRRIGAVLRRRSPTIALVLAGLVIQAAAVTATASPPAPGRWKLVSGVAPGEPPTSRDPGLYRSPDGKLHLAWVRSDGALSQALLYTSFSPAGDMLAPGAPIVQGFADLGDAAFVTTPQGPMEIFFGGQQSTASGAPTGLWTTLQNPDSSWGTPNVFTKTYGVVSAVWLNQPVLAYESQSSVAVKAGLGDGNPETLKSGFTDASPNIASDGVAHALVAWCAFGDNAGGTYVQEVDPGTGAGIGAPQAMPGSLTSYHGKQYSTCVLQTEASRRIPLVSAGGSFYTAGSTGYPTLTAVKLWQVGGRTLTAVRKSSVSHTEPQLAADSNGRVWIGWLETRSTGTRLVVRRSNRSVTVLGAPVRISAPKGFALGSFEVSATADHLDVIGQLTRASANSLQHTIALPGLTLVRERVRKLEDGRRAITLRVLDAGDPVGGARVTAQGHSATTAENGLAKLVVTGSPRARATKAGYTPARG